MLAYLAETFTAGVIQSYQGQGFLESVPLIERQYPLEDFKKFDQQDTIIQEYDPPPEEISTDKMVDVALEGHETRMLHTDCRRRGTQFACYFDTDFRFHCFHFHCRDISLFTTHLFAVVKAKNTPAAAKPYF